MKCTTHENNEANGICITCGKPFCEACLVMINDKYYCKEHVAELFKESINKEKGVDNLEYCDEINQNDDAQEIISPKSRGIALFLCIFFGTSGLHRFYVGKIGSGFWYFFTGGFFFIGWIIDIVTLCTGEFTDSEGRYLR